MAMKQLASGVYYAGYAMPYGIGNNPTGQFTVGGISIFPKSLKANPDAEMKEIKGPTGQMISIVVPVQNYVISGDGYVSTASGNVDLSAIKKGESVTVDQQILQMLGLTGHAKFRVESFDVNFQNEDVASVSYSFKEYPLIAAD